jgi:hypothetical protein
MDLCDSSLPLITSDHLHVHIHFIISILLLFFWVTNSNSNYKQVMTHESMSLCNTQEKPEKNITQTKPLFFLLALQPHAIKEINFKTTPLK